MSKTGRTFKLLKIGNFCLVESDAVVGDMEGHEKPVAVYHKHYERSDQTDEADQYFIVNLQDFRILSQISADKHGNLSRTIHTTLPKGAKSMKLSNVPPKIRNALEQVIH